MNKPDEKYVYHGSKELFEKVIPKRQVRSGLQSDGTYKIIFDDISFHASPYKWIALAYTFTPAKYQMANGRNAHTSIGVDLYNHTEKIDILGFNSLEESLEKMYGSGGFLFVFEKEKFFHTEGLGNLEVITKNNLTPVKIERVDDPVSELKKLGVRFNFVDLNLPENKKFQNCF